MLCVKIVHSHLTITSLDVNCTFTYIIVCIQGYTLPELDVNCTFTYIIVCIQGYTLPELDNVIILNCLLFQYKQCV